MKRRSTVTGAKWSTTSQVINRKTTLKLIPQKRAVSASGLDSTTFPSPHFRAKRSSVQPSSSIRADDDRNTSNVQAERNRNLLKATPEGSRPPKLTPLQLLEGLASSFVKQLDEMYRRKEEEVQTLEVNALSKSHELPEEGLDWEPESEGDEMLGFGGDAKTYPIVQATETSQAEDEPQMGEKEALKVKRTKQPVKTRQILLKVGVEGAQAKPSIYPFPALSLASSLRLARLLKVVLEMQAALVAGINITKRDIFYRDKALFGNQSVVDKLADSLSLALNVKRSALGIVAASKGLISGSLSIEKVDGKRFTSEEGAESLISALELEDVQGVESNASWILVVEKEAVFKTLLEEALVQGNDDTGSGIMVTGKGYPDLATRQMLSILSAHLPNIPILAIVDGDPHGLDILRIYKYGGITAVELALLDRIEWAGVKGSECSEFGVDEDLLLTLSATDRVKVLGMLKLDPSLPEEWRRELARSLHSNKKSEIEILCSLSPEVVPGFSDSAGESHSISSGALLPYVRSKIRRAIDAF